METSLERAVLLLEHGRAQEAASELRLLLASDPEDGSLHAYLALALLEQDQNEEALREADMAVGFEPDNDYCLFVKAMVLNQCDKVKEGERLIRTALAMYASDERYYALLCQILIRQKKWKEALEIVEKGLEINPEDIGCNNLRSFVLVHMGKRDEAGISLEATLMRDPENDMTHANKGWAKLHEGEVKEALHHFREALRINPGNEYARQGIINALKARNILYRPILSYFLWMSRLSGKAQWGVILGLYFGARVVRTMGRMSPEMKPIATVLMIAYGLFVYFSWTGQPLFNLLLSLDSYGKHALNDEEKVQSRWVGGFFFSGIALLIASFIMKLALPGILGAISILLVIPIAGTFNFEQGKQRNILGIYTLALAFFAYGGAILSSMKIEQGGNFLMVALLGLIGFQFFANYLNVKSM